MFSVYSKPIEFLDLQPRNRHCNGQERLTMRTDVVISLRPVVPCGADVPRRVCTHVVDWHFSSRARRSMSQPLLTTNAMQRWASNVRTLPLSLFFSIQTV